MFKQLKKQKQKNLIKIQDDSIGRTPKFCNPVDDQKMWVVDSPDFVVNSAVSIDLQSTNLVQYLRLVKLDKVMNDDVWRPEKLKI